MEQPPKSWYKYRGRIICSLLALIFAILWMTIGFSQTILIFIITAIGYLIGAYLDGDLDMDAWANFFMK